MSPTRKPRPPDKDAPPEHKPSRKVALDEVMRTLQDLVSNELAIKPPQGPGESAASKAAKPRASSAQAAESAVAPQPIEVPGAEITQESESITLESLPDVAAVIPSESKPANQVVPTTGIPAGGLQQELPYLDAQSPVPDAGLPGTAAASRVPEQIMVENEAGNSAPGASPADAADQHAPLDATPQSVTGAAAVTVEEISWDDIPVLEEAVELPEEIEAIATGQALDAPAATNLPPADKARRLAIQVAARLNVELRKSGQGGLNSDVITRLARLLEEALAKGAPNMENTPPDKH